MGKLVPILSNYYLCPVCGEASFGKPDHCVGSDFVPHGGGKFDQLTVPEVLEALRKEHRK